MIENEGLRALGGKRRPVTRVVDTPIGKGFVLEGDGLAIVRVGRVLVRPHGRARKGKTAYLRDDGKVSTYWRERNGWRKRPSVGTFLTDGVGGEAALLANVP